MLIEHTLIVRLAVLFAWYYLNFQTFKKNLNIEFIDLKLVEIEWSLDRVTQNELVVPPLFKVVL